MRDFLKAEQYFLKKESGYKNICLLLLVTSVLLTLWIRSSTDGWDVDNFLEPLSVVVSMSIFLYFILPIHTCFFATEGFESGTIKNVLSSGKSRMTYYMGKLFIQVKVTFRCLIQFYGVFLALFYLAALFSGSSIKNVGLEEQLLITVPAVFYHALYLIAYTAIVMMVGIMVRKTASATIVTFALVFGDLMVSGYWKESTVPLLRTLSEHSLMTQIFKFSGLYVVNSKRILLSGVGDYLSTALIPIGIIMTCTIVGLLVFGRRDI